MNTCIKKYIREHALSVVGEFKDGENNDGTYKVIDKTGIEKVLKVALSNHAMKEIMMNLKGYEALRACHLESFIPGHIEFEVDGECGFLLMDYCGNNFLTAIRQTADPIHLYERLARELKIVYEKSKRENTYGTAILDPIFQRIHDTYYSYLRDELDPNGAIVQKLEKMHECFKTETFAHICFSNWDFTPEDVYLTAEGLKYSDPHDVVLGIPIIDITCFSALIVLYDLPEKKIGEEILMGLVREYIPQMLCLTSKQARDLHALGKVLQTFLSAKARMNDHSLAQNLLAEGVSYIDSILVKS